MNRLWTYLEEKKWKAEQKYLAAFLILGILFAALGFTSWYIIQFWALGSWDWMICFIGYPIMISWILVYLYSCRHGFHDGTFS